MKSLRCRKEHLIRISLFALLFLVGCKEQIVHDLSESEANKLITRLGEASIDAEKAKQSDSKWALKVDSSDSMRAIQILSESRILKQERPSADSGSSVIASRDDQRFAYERRLSTELEHTISTLDGVLDARVHLNLPPVDPLFGEPTGDHKGTGSVLIIASNKNLVDSFAIASLVSGASGITKERISVLLSTAANPSTQALQGVYKSDVLLPSSQNIFSNVSMKSFGAGYGQGILFLMIGVALAFLYKFFMQNRKIKKLVAFNEISNEVAKPNGMH